MTGRQAYTMFTKAFGEMYDHWRKQTQFDFDLTAWDDLSWQEKGAWRNVAKQIERRTERSVAARKVSS